MSGNNYGFRPRREREQEQQAQQARMAAIHARLDPLVRDILEKYLEAEGGWNSTIETTQTDTGIRGHLSWRWDTRPINRAHGAGQGIGNVDLSVWLWEEQQGDIRLSIACNGPSCEDLRRVLQQHTGYTTLAPPRS